MFQYIKKWRAQRLKLKLWQRERARFEQLRAQPVSCLSCHALAPRGAFFCPMCGISLQGQLPQQPQQTTGPIVATERPLLDYLHKHHSQEGPNTQIHRAVHLPPGYKTGAIKRIYDVMREDKK